MARKKKKKSGDGGPAWLITFSDMMTLMLTFFVLLVSMSTIDERRKLVVISSVTGTFGEGIGALTPQATKPRTRMVEPGPMDLDNTDDLEPLKDMLWEEDKKDLNFQENQFVQILSINDEVLFTPGTTQLSQRGIKLLNRILPWLLRINHPLLIAGHTATLREERGDDYKVVFGEREASPTWTMSFMRSMSVYRYLTGRGMPAKQLSVEAFGKYRPRFDGNTPEGRRQNRRVDIVLDKRNKRWIETMARLKEQPQKEAGSFKFKDFLFKLGEFGKE